tara:strand:- start:105 stop:500 length:396 start_codon:yes stop_codon:yes gene_type:complete
MQGHNRLWDLVNTWRRAKHAEDQAREARFDCESEMMTLIDTKPEGTSWVLEDGDGSMKVRTGMKRNWSQRILKEASDEIAPAVFPFRFDFREERERSKFIENNEPEIWKVISPGLTLKPKKPYFFYQEDDD